MVNQRNNYINRRAEVVAEISGTLVIVTTTAIKILDFNKLNNTMENKPNTFDYFDCRKFLLDFYKWKKQCSPVFSYKSFS